MPDSMSPFELLGLPISATKPDDLAVAYRAAREKWFLKQFEPLTMIEAHEKVRAIDEAYQALRDPRRQTALLREAHKRPRRENDWDTPSPDHSSAPSAPPARVVNRSKIVRELLQQAREIISRTKQVLSDETKKSMTRQAFDEGLDFTDAEEIVERIVKEVEFGIRPRTTRRSPA
ncbi:J domain-containing protein [bacterium]|nr:J domain-containing protein [bacterium]